MTILWYLRLIIMNSWANHHESWENFHMRFPWFRTEHRNIQPDARINLWCQSYWSASKIYNLEYLFWIKSSRRPEIPPKDGGGGVGGGETFINFVARSKRWLWRSYWPFFDSYAYSSWIMNRHFGTKKKRKRKKRTKNLKKKQSQFCWLFLNDIFRVK